MIVQEMRVETQQGAVFGELQAPAEPKMAALLIGGSGPHDRNGVQGTFDAGYAAWAQALAQAGIAVLRLDKPGSGASPMPTVRPVRYDHDIARNQAALSMLAQTFQHLPLALLGHSLGALTALELRHERLCAIAYVAGMGRSLDRVLAAQVQAILQREQVPQDEQDKHLRERLDLMATFREGGVVKNMPPWAGNDPEPWIHIGDAARRDPVALLSQAPTPLCLLRGTADDRTFETDWAFARAATPQAKALVVEGMDHFLRMPDGALNKDALAWLAENLLACLTK